MQNLTVRASCESQEEIDYYWDAFIKNGGGKESQCGWLKDKFGVSWQIVPNVLGKFLSDPDPKKAQRVTAAFLKMKKFNIQALQNAYDGK